ncbi:MAG: hypothetical protein RL594_1427 [Bacteroidota bacterium]|jgi:hypothetical protein
MVMMKFLVALHLTVTAVLTMTAQDVTIRGKVLDAGDASPLPSATVRLVSVKDSSVVRGSYTERDGSFKINNVPVGAWKMTISYIGYRKMESTQFVRESRPDLGVFRLGRDTVSGKTVDVEATAVRMEVKGDTMDYNAQAFKTNPNATAEDLVKKMPGITVENGAVRAQGEEVRRVTVDGREFFGDDAQATLRNLPADMVDRVQVFDRGSDLSMFSGFDDGNTSKQMNLVTRKDRRNGAFGRVYAGYGTEDRYGVGGTINDFRGMQRITVLGLSNNINQQNFAFQDILGMSGGGGGGMGGGMGRMMQRYMSGGGAQMMQRMGGGGGGGPFSSFSNFFVGQQGGITATNALGMNYSDMWGDRTNVSSSYFFNYADNDRTSTLDRTFVAAQNAGQLYNQQDTSLSINRNHRFNMRIESVLDSANVLVISPRVSLQASNANSLVTGLTSLRGQDLNATLTDNATTSGGYSASISTTYRRLLSKSGRSFAATLNVDRNDRWNDGALASANQFFIGLDSTIRFDQRSDGTSDGTTIGGQLAYTEPIGERDMIQLTYEPSISSNASDRTTRTRDTTTGEFSRTDSLLSNTFRNDYQTHRIGGLYRWRMENTIVTFGGNYQYAVLTGDQSFPLVTAVERTFGNFLPTLLVQHKWSASTNIRMFYRTSTNAPSISQLQNVVNNSNPLQLSIGNPNLVQEYTHSVNARFVKADWLVGKTMFAVANVSYTSNYIGNSSQIVLRDTTIGDVQPITLGPGGQISRPVNLDGNWNVRSFFTYGFPIWGMNLNTNAALLYSRTPGLINAQTNYANSTTGSLGFFLSSSSSEDLDLSFNYNGSYTWVANTLQTSADDNYFTHLAGLRVIWNIGALACSTDVNQTLYSGLGTGFNRTFTVWNAGIGYRFLENRAAELRLTVNDILNQNDAINRSINDVTIEDSRTNALRRYAQLTFSYDLKSFAPQGGGPGRSPMGR